MSPDELRALADALDKITPVMGLEELHHMETLDRAADFLRQCAEQREPLSDALKTVIYELAALIPNPDKTLVDDWPCENAADRQCLQIAYTTARSVLHGIGGSDDAK